MTESELQHEVQILADAIAAKTNGSTAHAVGIMLGAIWELAQRELPDDLVAAQNWHHRALAGFIDAVAALRR